MPHANRLIGHFTPHRRFSNKLPRLYLDSVYDPNDSHHLEVFFVNNSGQPLEWVKLNYHVRVLFSIGSSEELASHVEYLCVQPNEAVKVAEFDIVFDSDFVHQIELVWKATGEPESEVRITEKGTSKFAYTVLEWLPHAPGE